jgi:hypothetical protein
MNPGISRNVFGTRLIEEESPYKPDPVLRLREWGTIHLVARLLA